MSNYIERYWRDAKPEDAIKEPPMVARFRDEGECWEHGQLVGWDRTDRFTWRSESCTYVHCQVYDAPDPGEGWRLIDPESTRRVPSDERWCPALSKWLSPDDCYCDRYEDGCFYRRRIEQPKLEPKYVPFTWEDREQLRGRWIVQVESIGTEQMVNKLDLINNDLFANNKCARQLLDGWRFLESNEPVGKRIV